VLTAAATATPAASPVTGLAPLLTLTMIVVTVGYSGVCWIWPFRACRHCHGMGRHHGPWRGIRLCHHCDATGLRLRFGRRMWTAGRRAYRDAKPRVTRRR
jgi:hypothetical protein